MRRRHLLPLLTVLCLLGLCLAGPAWAEDSPRALPHAETPDPDVAEVEELIATIEARIKALGAAGDNRDDSLEFLTLQVEKAIGGMAVQQGETDDLVQRNAELTWQIETLAGDRGELKSELLEVSSRHAVSLSDLEAELKNATLLLALERDSKDALASAKDDLLAKLESADSDRQALGQANSAQQQEIARLNGEIAALQGELASAERQAEKKAQDLATLQDRLEALQAHRVEALARHRADFFARLRSALGAQADMWVEGERFVIQSEALFTPGTVEIVDEGQRQLAALARSLHDVSRGIPNELDWLLRVDGHTARQTERDLAFGLDEETHNWELSAARATRIVRFLIRQGVPPYRLAATGFGEFQPLDAGNDEIAQRRNRRIEFTLTRK